MVWFFACTLFLSAALLFLVQPLVAKLLLPSLGGTPAVWNTCQVFFQVALLAGYAYAHAVPSWVGVRRQAALHLGLLLIPLLFLPLSFAALGAPPGDANPLPWLGAALTGRVAVPFLAVAATAPLLQRWFAATGHPSARDPYFLYGASNAGSLAALVAFPFVVEPRWTLQDTAAGWAWGYGALGVLIAGCAVLLWRSPPAPATQTAPTGPLTWRRRLRWLLLAFAPSSLLLGLTTYLTTDLAAVPLLWVGPLALYLVTFILAFARREVVPPAAWARLWPWCLVPLTAALLVRAAGPLWLLVPWHVLTFFVAAMLCHGELARDRPEAGRLTEFYLWMSVGGALGGAFNALLAPVLFPVVAEYPLALALVCLVAPPHAARPGWRWADGLAPLGLAAAAAGVFVGLERWGLGSATGYDRAEARLALGLLAGACFPLAARPARFGLAVGGVLLVGLVSDTFTGQVLYRERSFFGAHRVITDPEGRFRLLMHGNTNHGMQSTDPARRREPLAYYHRTGPLGQVFAALAGRGAAERVGVIGLGSGAIACYVGAGQAITFYEIDPAVARIARDGRWFTFLGDCPGRVAVVLGDGRLTLREAPDRHHRLLVLDAFSADAIPLHLLTREALDLYLTKLADGGVLAVHVTNRYVNLEGLLGDQAAALGLVCLAQEQRDLTPAERAAGKYPAHYVVLARRREDLGPLADDPRWHTVPGRPGARVWTDDYSNLPGVLRWGE